MEGKREEPETINVWELMSGLDDDESSPRSTPFPAIPVPKHMAVSAALAAKLSSDSFTLEPSNLTPKPHWQPSLKVNGSHGRSPICASEDPVDHMSACRDSGFKISPIDTLSSNGASLFGSVSGSNTSSVEILANNLQRSLSFKLAFNSENKGILGLEDTLFSDHSKDNFSYEVVTSLASNRRASEGDSATTPSTPSFSATAKLKKWFQANKRASKLQNAMKGASKSSTEEAWQKKQPSQSATSSNVSSMTLFSGSSGKTSDSGSTHTVRDSGSSHNVIDGGSSRKGSDDFSESNGDTTNLFNSTYQTKVMEAAQGGPVRRYRHSFTTAGNQKKQSIEDSVPQATINRPSSWELEKVAVEPGGKAVLYSTNSRTDINAYEDSNAVRAILISLVGSSFDEKSLSQHPDYEQELKNALNLPVVAVPTVCVRGKYIAGIDNIMQLFKKGLLGSLLLETLPHGLKPNAPCMCRGGKFLICPICKGKRRLTRGGEEPVTCRHCIGTGLLKCPSCPKP
eukprot:c11042_g1_i1 orf=357-1892(-)